MSRRFRQVDVFGEGPYDGNPVAVVLDAEGLHTEDMRRFSVWSNLSECTFVVPAASPEADYRVRIFSLNTELPFAGHPMLGAEPVRFVFLSALICRCGLRTAFTSIWRWNR